MSVYFSADDGYVRIYEMTAGGKGNELTPSKGWTFVQGITLTENERVLVKDRLGATRNRLVSLGSTMNLSVERWHAGGDEFGFANDRTKEYIIELLFYDRLEGDTEPSLPSDPRFVQLAYCKPNSRSLATGRPANNVSRSWGVGEITADTFTDTSTLAWKTQTFTSATSVVVNHNLGYKPIVWLEDTNGAILFGVVKHTSNNSFTVTFQVAQSGTIHYA